MTKVCNFPISEVKRCKQRIADDRPNCGRHKTSISADQLGQSPTIYKKDGKLHIWAGEPDNVYCLIHGDPAYQVLCQLAREMPLCCLQENIYWRNKQGEPHRDDGPAVIETDGTRWWYQRNERHRDDGPAMINADGIRSWWQHGKLHRDDGPAVISADGTQERWYRCDELHRDGGPAVIEADGTQSWYQHGELHREDGPAIIEANGTQLWYWHGKQVAKEKHARWRAQSRGV